MGCLNETNADPHADGIPNFLDDDSDGDSISDLIEGDADSDADGMPDFLDAATIGENTGEKGDEVTEVLRAGTGGDGDAISSGRVDPLLPLFLLSPALG